MSQHKLILDKGKRMVVGWDGPLRTFFGDVYDDSVEVKDDGSNYKDWHLVELGLMTGVDIHYAEDLQEQLAEAGYELPHEVVIQLEMDKLSRGTYRYPSQQGGLDMLGYKD